MKYQLTEYNCGPAAVQNAFRALGHRVGQASIATVAGTSTEGTDEEGIKRALLHYGYVFTELSYPKEYDADDSLSFHLSVGSPVIIPIDRWLHWVTVVGWLGGNFETEPRYVVIDSARWGWNKAENGVKVLTRQSLVKRWRVPRRVSGKEDPFYGIAVVKQDS